MSPLFADTSFYVALVEPRDALHPKAVQASAAAVPIVTTEYVLLELANFLSRGRARQAYLDLVAALRSSASVVIIPSSAELFDRGSLLFADRPDKEWSLTDCISFVVMQAQGVTQALTGDHHFEQAGFTALLK